MNWEYQGSIVPGDVGKTVTTESSFADQAAELYRAQTASGTTEYKLLFSREPLLGESLLNVLTEASFTAGDSIEGVLDDWELPKQAERQYPAAKKLVKRHERIPGWEVFVDNQPSFVAALGAHVIPVGPSKQYPQATLVDYESAQATARRTSYGYNVRTLLDLCGQAEINNGRQLLIRSLRYIGDRERRSAKQYSDNSLLKYYEKLSPIVHRMYTSAFWGQLDTEQHDRLASSIVARTFDRLETYDGREVFAQKSTAVTDSVKAQNKAADKAVVYRAFVNGHDTKVNQYIVEDKVYYDYTTERIYKAFGLQAVLHWVVNSDRQRTFILNAPELKTAEPLSETESVISSESNLLGLVALSCLSADFRQSSKRMFTPDAGEWGSGQRLPGGGRRQPIGPAQISLFTIMFQDKLAKSSLLAAAENIKKQPITPSVPAYL